MEGDGRLSWRIGFRYLEAGEFPKRVRITHLPEGFLVSVWKDVDRNGTQGFMDLGDAMRYAEERYRRFK